MRNILAARNRPRLRRLARQQALLAFDFDGTLSPIVENPSDAGISVATAELLDDVAQRYPVAIISGRSVDDVKARLRGARAAAIVGNHGIEPSTWMHDAAAAVAAWAPVLTAGVAGLEGVKVENKRHSLSVHYRQAPSSRGAQRAIREVVERLPGDVRVVDGHKVVNVVPAGAPHKGDALLSLAAQFGASAVLFVGDDVTDEDAFAVLTDDESLGVRVCASANTHARWYVPTQPDVDRLLAALIAARPG